VDTGDGAVATGADLVEVARRRAAELSLREGDRLLTVLPWEQPADWVDGLLAPLAAGATVVLCANPDPDLLRPRTEAEQVTATLGVTVTGVRPL
jgi:acyl-CoA synthetase (AMP-forming)/AMP-acid ligase II